MRKNAKDTEMASKNYFTLLFLRFVILSPFFRKLGDKNLAKELERELEINTSLKRKARMLEDKVGKFKQIVLKLAKKQESKKSLM